MKRIYTILSCLLLAGMLCIGLYALLDKDATYSESERRKLKTRPKLTFSAMLDGSYASDYRDYFADTFPNREKLMNANRSLNGFYYFSGGSKDGAQLVINMNGGAANHGEALQTTDDTTPSSSTQPSGTSGTATDSTEPTEPTQPTQTQDPDAAAEELGSVLVVGDRAMEVPYGDKDTIRSYADAVNDIAAKLGSGVRTFSIAVPNAAAFYAPAENQHMLQTDMIAACYDRLKELKSTAIAVDAYSKLEAHKDEYLYFRSDHHWTALGAIKKGGTMPLVEVLEEGERPTKKGFVIMDAPAPGVENLTAIVSGGCHAVIFSTGKGNCIGHPVAPVIKISGNPMTVKSMRDNIDVDVSGVINQGLTLDQATDIVQDKLVDVCWGAMTSSDMLGEIETAASRLLRTL